MRRRNLSLVLHAVAGHGEISRAAVAAEVGLTRAAVSTLVEELLSLGLLAEAGLTRPGTVGRPGTALVLSDRGPAGLGAEVGVDHLAACVVDLRGKVRASAYAEAPNRDHPPERVLADLAGLVVRVAREGAAAGLRPVGITVAVPGLVGRDPGTVERASNLGWEQVPAGPLLTAALADAEPPAGTPAGTPADDPSGDPSHAPSAGPPSSAGRLSGLPIGLDNEANLGALAELWLGGHDRGLRHFLHVSAEIGIGAALVVEGRLFRGAHGHAGELGHVPVRPAGPACPCGARGCLEQYAGEEAVLRAAGLDPARAAAEHPGPGGRVRLLAERAGTDPAVRRALHRAGSALGLALSGAVNVFDPQKVVLGGGLAELSPWLLPGIESELRRRVTDRHWPDGAVAVSSVGREGPLLGAANSIVRSVLDDPTSVRPREEPS
ncbi:ROK family transcriptional regulator [Streptomyces sp. HB2AG]|uniref:ROK family transcriptional regulator n=1 Tax=Streptomyces sp. HB2AG TaxID=2983400 RepID=UPI0022AA0342|nr:ROK family transcriptional regulator [Streptomyces sp. HB2AG]MCZ2525681.1 ROK family transcriptional regulator [Streptomyces sp. HB2AG]